LKIGLWVAPLTLVVELAEAQDLGAKTRVLASPSPSIQPLKNQ
jgi:hypothetical protein